MLHSFPTRLLVLLTAANTVVGDSCCEGCACCGEGTFWNDEGICDSQGIPAVCGEETLNKQSICSDGNCCGTFSSFDESSCTCVPAEPCCHGTSSPLEAELTDLLYLTVESYCEDHSEDAEWCNGEDSLDGSVIESINVTTNTSGVNNGTLEEVEDLLIAITEVDSEAEIDDQNYNNTMLQDSCERCEAWFQANSNRTWILDLPQCPCEVVFWPRTAKKCTCRAKGSKYLTGAKDGINWDTDLATNPCLDLGFHPGAACCLRQRQRNPLLPNQQCCYDRAGQFIPHGNPGAGTPDKNGNQGHQIADVQPYNWCCKNCPRLCHLYIGCQDCGWQGARSDPRSCASHDDNEDR